jgi:uncharacterized protein
MEDRLLTRIAEALERLAPSNQMGGMQEPISSWNGSTFSAVRDFKALPLELLAGIDQQKQALLENTRRLAKGHASHDALLWGVRGAGKSALIKSVVQAVRSDGHALDLIQVPGDQITTLSTLFQSRTSSQLPVVIFIDDLGLDHVDETARKLRSLLDGGVQARPSHTRLYVTSNKRHIVQRNMQQQDGAVNPRDVADDQLALADRFGLSLGFHACSQDDYIDMVSRYAEHFGLPIDTEEALTWAAQRGARSGRVAWHYIVELAGKHSQSIG